MVCKAFSVLTAIAKIERQAHLFADASTIGSMCERIALPNMAIRSTYSLLIRYKYDNSCFCISCR